MKHVKIIDRLTDLRVDASALAFLAKKGTTPP